eukprot:281600-Pleurochrysis_carterae.AAC.1
MGRRRRSASQLPARHRLSSQAARSPCRLRYLRIRMSKLFGSAAYAILNELKYRYHYDLLN